MANSEQRHFAVLACSDRIKARSILPRLSHWARTGCISGTGRMPTRSATAVKQADMRIDPRDDFAVKLQHQTQHAVRGRMLRSEIDGEIAECWFGH